jgi:hypothetical protein
MICTQSGQFCSANNFHTKYKTNIDASLRGVLDKMMSGLEQQRGMPYTPLPTPNRNIEDKLKTKK